MSHCPVQLSTDSVQIIIDTSDGYPYFIQYICREVYDAFLQRLDKGERTVIPITEIIQKLDNDFFAGRWAKTTDRQRALLFVIAQIDKQDEGFTIQKIVKKSKEILDKPFNPSNTNQMLGTLITQGLIYKDNHGQYLFAVPLLNAFIHRQYSQKDLF